MPCTPSASPRQPHRPKVFLGHVRQPVDVGSLAADNAVFDKVVPEAKGPDVKDADVKADGEWKLQLDTTVG